MLDAAQAFARALDEEREAAVRADFDTLLRVQEEKRVLLPLLKAVADPAVVDELSERARKNLRLLRHLVACVQGALGVTAESTYTAHGHNAEQQRVTQPALRGRV